MKVLVINAGSSSLKYQLMVPETKEVLAKGLCERIGIDGRLTHKVPATDGKYEFNIPMPTHAEAIQAVLDALTSPEHGVIKSSPRSTPSDTAWSMAARSSPAPCSSTTP